MGERDFRNNYKGHMDKTKEGWNQGREVGIAGVGGEVGGKGRKLYLNNNKKFFKSMGFRFIYIIIPGFTII